MADTHIVDAQNPDIQAAINAAESGDTIEVHGLSDNYYNTGSGIIIDKPLIIIGVDMGSGLPILSFSSDGTSLGITVNAADVTIDRLILRYSDGPAIDVPSGDNVVIQNCIIEYCDVGISMSGSNINVIGCEFNYVSEGSISVDAAYDCVIDSVLIESVEGSPWYGIWFSDSSDISVIDTQVRGNSFNQVGDSTTTGILIESSSGIVIEGCDITWFDMGIGISSSSGTSVNDSVIWECYQNSAMVEDSPGTVITWCNFGPYSQYMVYTNGDCTGSVFYRNWFYTSLGNGGVYSAGTGIRWNSTAPVSYTYQSSDLANYNGNFWDNYYGYDDDLDGVGDTPHSPYANVIDYYPLVTESRQHKYVYFYAPSVVIYEGDTDVPVFINMAGGLSDYTSVQIEPPQGTAVYGINYLSRPSLSQGTYQGTWLSFEPEQASNVVYIDTIADDQIEDDKWINLSLVTGNPSPSPDLVINRSLFNLTILDTSQYPSVDIQTSNTTADEGSAMLPVTVVRSGAANGSVDVGFSLSGTAVAGTDYTYEPSSLHFARGERYKTINLTLRSDSLVEGAETIIISLTDATGATPGERTACAITIHDMTTVVTPTPVPTGQPSPAPTPTPTPSPTPTPVPEPVLPSVAFYSSEGSGDEGATAYIVIVRSDNLTVPCDVAFNVAGGTAVYGVDYTCSPAPGTIHFASGENTGAIRVKLFEDTVADVTSTAVFSLSGAGGVSIGSPSSFTLRISDTTNKPVIGFYEPGVYADEGTKVTIVVQRVGPKDLSADVLLDIQGITAVYGQDFSCSPGPGRIQFGPGESFRTLTVDIAGDSTAQGHSTAKLVLSDPHGAGLGNTSTFTLYIRDLQSTDPLPNPGNTTTVNVRIPVSEVVPGNIFGFPAVIVTVLTGYMMIRLGGRRKGDRQ